VQARTQAAASGPAARTPAQPPPAPVSQGPAAKDSPAPETGAQPPVSGYTVQVLATRYRSEAESLTATLKTKGYGAYLVEVRDGGATWYRVRIGHFENSEAARRLASRASKELGLTQAYVSPLSSGSR
jgi:cell division septation protein DedD